MTMSHRWQFDAYNQPVEALSWRPHELGDPGPGQVLLKILAVGMNRSEFNYVQGKYAPARAFPSGIGQEAVGEILALGPDSADGPRPHSKTPLTVGSRVALLPGRVDMCDMGTYRDVGLFDRAALAPVPPTYTDAEAAALWMGVLTMAGAFEMAGITPESAKGKTVLITAASSSMGVIALKLAQTWGATTVASSRSVAKSAQLAALSDHVIVAADSEALATEIGRATDNKGFDVALDPVGEAFYPGLIESAAVGAQIISYEMITGREPVLPIALMMMKNLSFGGYTIFRPYRIPGLLSQVIDWGMTYAEQIKPIVAATHPLDNAPTILEELGRCEHVGKLVLVPQKT